MLFQCNPQFKCKKNSNKVIYEKAFITVTDIAEGEKQWLFMYKVEINKSGKLSALVLKKRGKSFELHISSHNI